MHLRTIIAAALALAAVCRAQTQPPLPTVILANPALAGLVLPWQDPGDLTPGHKLIDGDIQVPISFNPLLDATYTVNLWPNGVVPYEYDANVIQAWRSNMQQAMNEWSIRTGVVFTPRGSQPNYVHIQDSTGNNSPVGWRTGQTTINITSWDSIFTLAHELGHCLGYFHEHQRADRNTYVQINQANVQTAYYNNNFPIVASSTTWGPYDFGSLMHYGECSFSTCCPPGFNCACPASCETITVRAPWNTEWATAIGQRVRLSSLDWGVMRGHYPLIGDRWLDGSYSGTVSGTFRQPYNGTFQAAFNSTPLSGNLFIAPGTYTASTVLYNSHRWIRAPGGGVRIH